MGCHCVASAVKATTSSVTPGVDLRPSSLNRYSLLRNYIIQGNNLLYTVLSVIVNHVISFHVKSYFSFRYLATEKTSPLKKIFKSLRTSIPMIERLSLLSEFNVKCVIRSWLCYDLKNRVHRNHKHSLRFCPWLFFSF